MEDMIIRSVTFSACTSSGCGGAIYTVGHGYDIISSIFSNCQSTETGMAIFSNFYKVPTDYSSCILNQTLITNNIGQYLSVDVNSSKNICSNNNITSNKCLEHNDPSSARQYCSAINYLNDKENGRFEDVNLFEDGDFLIDIDYQEYNIIYYANIINNTNLNFFFHYNTELKDQVNYYYGPFIKVNYFTFFLNTSFKK